MRNNLTNSIVRFRHDEHTICGTGVVISQSHVLTCAHVINLTLGRLVNSSAEPVTSIPIEFPFHTPHKQLMGTVECWKPSSQQNLSGDIAILKLEAGLPPETTPARFGYANDVGHGVAVYGYPSNQAIGDWTQGHLLGLTSVGWSQLADMNIRKGYSGAPVWSKHINATALGIVVSKRGQSTSYMISTQKIASAWKPFEQIVFPYPLLLESVTKLSHSTILEQNRELTKLATFNPNNLPICRAAIVTAIGSQNFTLAQYLCEKYPKYADDADYIWFLSSLSLLHGKRPYALYRDEAEKVEKSLYEAIRLNSNNRAYWLLLLHIKVDYFRANGYLIKGLSIQEVLNKVKSSQTGMSDIPSVLSLSHLLSSPTSKVLLSSFKNILNLHKRII